MSTKNATARKDEQEKKEANNKAQTPANLKKVEDEKKPGKAALPSAGERIERMSRMQKLADHFRHLKEKQDELEEFKISSDGTAEKLQLSNGRGFNVLATNSNIIKKVVELLSSQLSEKLAHAERELIEFEV